MVSVNGVNIVDTLTTSESSENPIYLLDGILSQVPDTGDILQTLTRADLTTMAELLKITKLTDLLLGKCQNDGLANNI